jgi:hypothetical protein
MAIQPMNNKVLSDNGDGGIIENWGTFAYLGAANNNQTEVDMAFLNHGTVTLDGGPNALSADKIYFNAANTGVLNGYSFKQDGGSTQMKNFVTLTTKAGYYQTGGHLQTLDTTSCKLQGGIGAVAAELDGGDVQLNTNGAARGAGFGRLIGSGNIVWNGATWLCMLAPAGNSCDIIDCGADNIVIKKMTLTLSMAAGRKQGNAFDWEIWGRNTTTVTGWNATNVTLSPAPPGWTITGDWTGGDIDGN